ncbi:NUDIX domain-containing protein [Cytobacillus gottheilii]|uniref:NUDIX domain-containing protein n=1 Tax=Cytobacillus gottheilii TaxID=859144 RepID=UPI0009BBB91B|nr:NUDIX hydrolase [Cytobacillus gottheilii]
MRLRQMAVVFLLSEDQDVLFLQKKSKDSFFAGFLVPIGGHIEGHEINEPQEACLREIEEETGLKREFIENLKLRYIVHRIKENQEIRLQYVFFGNVSKINTLIESDEGSLAWVGYNDILRKNVSATTIEIVKHYKEIGKSTENVYVGSMRSLKGNPTITWGLLEDWEK